MTANYREYLQKSVDGSVDYGGMRIEYELVRSGRRTLEVSVHPDKRVLVRAPLSTSLDKIEAWVKKRAPWIRRQFDYFNQYEPRTPECRYINGESHHYLGRKYRLKILPEGKDDITLRNGYFHIQCVDQSAEHIRGLLEQWYRGRAQVYLTDLFDECWTGFDQGALQKPKLKIRKMKTRWGSCSTRGAITLNSVLIQAPRSCIEYVITHELCHLVHHNHSNDFYHLLTQNLPDWKQRKRKLEMALI